jgi:uncharacterized membrane protein
MSHGEFHDDQNPYSAPQSQKGYGPGALGEPKLSGRRVSFDAISEAFDLLKAKLGTWFLISLVYLIASGGISFAVSMGLSLAQVALLAGAQDDLTRGVITVVFFLANMLISLVLGAFFTGGMYLAALKQVRGERFGVEDLFGASAVLLPLVVAQLLVILATYAGLICLIIPGIYVAVRLLLTIPLVVDRGLSATDAMKWSWRALQGQVFMMFAVYLCAAILSFLGVLLCCVGLLFTMPITYLTAAVIYRDLFISKTKTEMASDVFFEPL